MWFCLVVFLLYSNRGFSLPTEEHNGDLYKEVIEEENFN